MYPLNSAFFETLFSESSFIDTLLSKVSVHGKKKSAAGPMDQLFRKAAGPQQELPVHTLD